MATAVSDLLTMSPAQLDELFTRSDSGPTCLSAHILDLIMQSLGIKTQSSPFEAPYFSCVPYLLGEGQAMQYSVWPKSKKRTPIPRLPLRGAFEAPAHDECRATLRTDWRRGIRLGGFA